MDQQQSSGIGALHHVFNSQVVQHTTGETTCLQICTLQIHNRKLEALNQQKKSHIHGSVDEGKPTNFSFHSPLAASGLRSQASGHAYEGSPWSCNPAEASESLHLYKMAEAGPQKQAGSKTIKTELVQIDAAQCISILHP